MVQQILKVFLVLSVLLDPAWAEEKVSVEAVQKFCQLWFPALVRGVQDPDIAADKLVRYFYTENAELLDPNFSEAQVGQTRVKSYYRTLMSKYPNWTFEVQKIYPTETGFVLYYVGHVPPLVESFRGVDIIEIEGLDRPVTEWRISKLVGFYDRVPFQKRESQ